MLMNNQEIAIKVSDFVFEPSEENSSAHATKIMIENLVFSSSIEDYTKDYLKDRVLIFLESIDSIKGDV